MRKFIVWGVWILGTALVVALTLFGGYWVHERIFVAQYSKKYLAQFFQVPSFNVVITKITLEGDHPWSQIRQAHSWIVNYSITGKPLNQTGNIFEVDQSASGQFLAASIPTS